MLKVLNVKTNGVFTGEYEGAGFNADTTHTDLSSDTLKKINELISELEKDGYVEIHIEQNGLQNFVHKRSASTVDSEDNVNAYELFENMSWLSELDGKE